MLMSELIYYLVQKYKDNVKCLIILGYSTPLSSAQESEIYKFYINTGK